MDVDAGVDFPESWLLELTGTTSMPLALAAEASSVGTSREGVCVIAGPSVEFEGAEVFLSVDASSGCASG